MDPLINGLNDFFRYSADHIDQMLHDLAQPEYRDHRMGRDHPLSGLRGVLADAMDERGRHEEAGLLRTPDLHVVPRNGRVIDAGPHLGAERFSDEAFAHLAPINGWVPDADRDGSWGWWKKGADRHVHATPFWTGHPGIEVQVTHDDPYSIDVHDVPFDFTGRLHEDLNEYERLMRPFLTAGDE